MGVGITAKIKEISYIASLPALNTVCVCSSTIAAAEWLSTYTTNKIYPPAHLQDLILSYFGYITNYFACQTRHLIL